MRSRNADRGNTSLAKLDRDIPGSGKDQPMFSRPESGPETPTPGRIWKKAASQMQEFNTDMRGGSAWGMPRARMAGPPNTQHLKQEPTPKNMRNDLSQTGKAPALQQGNNWAHRTCAVMFQHAP